MHTNKSRNNFVICTINALATCAFLFSLVSGCKSLNEPPSADYAQSILRDHRSDINLVLEYLISSEYNSIVISNSTGEITADVEKIQITDTKVLSAIKRLLAKNVFYLIYKDGNTITFSCWRGTQDIGSGIAYSINGIDSPETQFMTQLTPLEDSGWYYYVEDYNLWRTQQAKSSRP